ncbi:uncharacterized protein ARB_05448 [Trichophyton benhamiae CBS 112371]|uniref:Secreted protein n=1 Tax=Arthroderma benhamiae (strain ATCC MYA-4681 / CBS 112371) TaxID=663331 RepID=D4AMJ5_ARTBC|nr:uncharacterized protein ARB_05448 [Trichophyton benhamiae CBS 112371]EFE35406.1 hypothetical protein ARB_05448 [Trichophyton benhamiae CBS 112371]
MSSMSFHLTALSILYLLYNKACSMPGRRAEKPDSPETKTKKKRKNLLRFSLPLLLPLFLSSSSSSFSVSILFHFDCAASLREKKSPPFFVRPSIVCIDVSH